MIHLRDLFLIIIKKYQVKFLNDLTFDSNFENKNNNDWFNDASLITNCKNLNENYRIKIDSAQTSKNYIQLLNQMMN